jgi:hypothetical protein
MLQLAAVGVAMNNAKPKAKAAADITVEVKRFYFRLWALSFPFVLVDERRRWSSYAIAANERRRCI